MGISLRLLPITHIHYGGHAPCWGFSHTILDLGGVGYDLIEEIQKLAKPLPSAHDISSFIGARVESGRHKGELCYGTLTKDVYDKPYTWITAEELRPFLVEHWLTTHPVTAYVVALPDDHLIILHWS